MNKEKVVFLSEYRQHKQSKQYEQYEQQERDYFKQMESISGDQLCNKNTGENFQKVNDIWYLKPNDSSGEYTQLCQDFGQKLDHTRQEKLLEELRPKTTQTIIYLASVRASKK